MLRRVVSIESRLAARAFSTASASKVKTVGVVGAGQMGTGIALVAANVAKLNVRWIGCTSLIVLHHLLKPRPTANLPDNISKLTDLHITSYLSYSGIAGCSR